MQPTGQIEASLKAANSNAANTTPLNRVSVIQEKVKKGSQKRKKKKREEVKGRRKKKKKREEGGRPGTEEGFGERKKRGNQEDRCLCFSCFFQWLSWKPRMCGVRLRGMELITEMKFTAENEILPAGGG